MSDEFKDGINNPQEERRKYPRLKIVVDVDYNIHLDEASCENKKTKSKNISSGGICIFVSEDIKLGSILDLNFKLTNDDPIIKTKGLVVWTNSFEVQSERQTIYELGIEFTEISESDKALINKYKTNF